jgi:hypothetical protein
MNKKVKTITSWLAVTVFLFALAVNVKVTLDDPFVFISDMAIASTSSNEKVVFCRRVDCSDTWSGTADVNGCINFFGKRKCIYGANAQVSFTYFGEKENCTGGDEWYDCNACQSDCVPEN